MIMGWIDPRLLRDFQSEGTDGHRLCTIEDGWVERFGNDVLISFKTVLARERLLEELQTWADWVDVQVRRVFARFIPRESERREPPALVVGDPGESLQTVATERYLRFGLDFGTGYSPGLFLDQRENRRYVRHIAPRRLLNCFAYTCSFSVCAACNGASTVEPRHFTGRCHCLIFHLAQAQARSGLLCGDSAMRARRTLNANH